VVVAVAAKRKKSKNSAHWSWRLAGLVLCAFFALGVMTGVSQPGHVLARRLQTLLSFWTHLGHFALVPSAFSQERIVQSQSPRNAESAPVALVERTDGFYVLRSEGALRGPVSLVSAADLPVLSGAGTRDAVTPQLLEYAGVLVRAEAELSQPVSEMRVGADGNASLFLDRSRTEIILGLDHAPLELTRAARVIRLWHGHEQLLTSLDMSTPGQAVMRLDRLHAEPRRAAVQAATGIASRSRAYRTLEETARR
jgi:cell division protein FtsQ